MAARASGLDILFFHGLGNETQASGSKEFYKVRQQQIQFAAGHFASTRRARERSVWTGGEICYHGRSRWYVPGQYSDAGLRN